MSRGCDERSRNRIIVQGVELMCTGCGSTSTYHRGCGLYGKFWLIIRTLLPLYFVKLLPPGSYHGWASGSQAVGPTFNSTLVIIYMTKQCTISRGNLEKKTLLIRIHLHTFDPPRKWVPFNDPCSKKLRSYPLEVGKAHYIPIGVTDSCRATNWKMQLQTCMLRGTRIFQKRKLLSPKKMWN